MTQGVTGLGWEIPDKGSSEGKSGIPKEERLYYIPSHRDLNRLGDEVDRRDLQSAGKARRYSPDALLQCQLDWRAGSHALSKGYYLASLGDDASGSRRVHGPFYNAPAHAPTVSASSSQSSGNVKTAAPAHSTLVLTRQGRVAAVLPIDRVAVYSPQPGEPSARRPFARIEQSDEGPLLRFYYKDRIYSSPLSPPDAASRLPGALPAHGPETATPDALPPLQSPAWQAAPAGS
ncbi:MAG: hypothetical protein IPK79_07085 [Vampirovibrionales bacterium]|nr:hypothetical protein [Vampirovibrionales bacterium]